jgi:CDP-diglyceride synthetase
MTLLGPILAGIVNSIFCKLNVFNNLKKPLDFNKKIKGKRIFGDNKTWKGLLGYIFFNIIFMVLVGIIYKACNIEKLNFFYINHNNTLLFNILVGALLGLFYALFELPNSFMKRRLDIKEGKTTKGFKKIFFILLDQADSVFGVALVVWMF